MELILFQASTNVILQNEVATFFYFVVRDFVVRMQFSLYEFSLNLNIL
jgi:hypothetical protein